MSDKKEELEKNEKQENTNTERNELQTKQQELDELTDRYKRILAEFENHKKRSQKEREGLYNSILGDVVEVILPILDNLENAVKVETADENYKKGIELVLKQFQDVLKSKGVEEIKAQGEKFDPEMHEAVMRGQNPDMDDDTVEMVLEKGYKLRDKVIRHSKVKVISNE